MGSSGKAGQAWIPVFLLGLMGVENEMEVIFYTILIARVNTVIQFLERNAMVEEDFSDVEENAEGLQKNLEGWAWSVIQWG